MVFVSTSRNLVLQCALKLCLQSMNPVLANSQAPDFLYKIQYGDDIRRVTIASLPNGGECFAALQSHVSSTFNIVSLKLTYVDTDGDKVTIASDSELREARREVGRSLKFNVVAAVIVPQPTPSAPPIYTVASQPTPSAPPMQAAAPPPPPPPPPQPSVQQQRQVFAPIGAQFPPTTPTPCMAPPPMYPRLDFGGPTLNISNPFNVTPMMPPVPSPAPLLFGGLQCPRRHTMHMTMLHEGAYRRGWQCDSCRRHGAITEARYCCPMCTYDLCLACSTRSHQLPVPSAPHDEMRPSTRTYRF